MSALHWVSSHSEAACPALSWSFVQPVHPTGSFLCWGAWSRLPGCCSVQYPYKCYLQPSPKQQLLGYRFSQEHAVFLNGVNGGEMSASTLGWQKEGNDGFIFQNRDRSSGDTDSQMFAGCGRLDAQVSLRLTSTCWDVMGCNVHCNL